MSKLKIVYWFDIPGQVVVRQGRRSQRLRLSERFARAIERASYRVKKQGEDGLFDPWHSVPQSYEGELPQAAQDLVARLEHEYDDERLDRLVRSSGRETAETAETAEPQQS